MACHDPRKLDLMMMMNQKTNNVDPNLTAWIGWQIWINIGCPRDKSHIPWCEGLSILKYFPRKTLTNIS
jgi:hypothetical protein